MRSISCYSQTYMAYLQIRYFALISADAYRNRSSAITWHARHKVRSLGIELCHGSTVALLAIIVFRSDKLAGTALA